MQDKEIIKALECCISHKNCGENCPYFKWKNHNFACIPKSITDTINLINKQQAEIERLKAENEKAKGYLANCFEKYEKTKIAKESLENVIYIAKAEAIKEFVKNLKQQVNNEAVFWYKEACTWGIHGIIDKLAEEMEGVM